MLSHDHSPSQSAKSSAAEVRHQSDHSAVSPARGFREELPVSFISLPTLWRYRLVLLGSVAVTMGLALAFLSLADKVYDLEVRIAFEQRDLASDNIQRADPGKDFLATEAEVLHSPILIRESLKRLPHPDPDQDDPVAEIMESLRVNPTAMGNVITMGYQHSSPDETAQRLQAIFETYRETVRERDKQAIKKNEKALVRQEQALQAELKKLRDEHARLRAESPWLGDDKDDRRESLTLDRLTEQLAEVRSHKLRQEQLLKWLKSGPVATADGDVPVAGFDEATRRTIQTLWQTWREAELQLGEARRIYGEKHFQRKNAEERERLARQAYEQEIAQLTARIQQELNLAETEENQLAAAYDKERKQQKGRETDLIAEQRLLAEIARVQTAHEDAWVALNAARRTVQKLADGDGPITAMLLDSPMPPDEPIWPQTVPVLAVSLFFSLLLGTAVIAMIDRWQVVRASIVGPEANAVPRAPTFEEIDAEHVARLESELRQLQAIVAGSHRPAEAAQEQPRS